MGYLISCLLNFAASFLFFVGAVKYMSVLRVFMGFFFAVSGLINLIRYKIISR